jgi:hypothetical protein
MSIPMPSWTGEINTEKSDVNYSKGAWSPMAPRGFRLSLPNAQATRARVDRLETLARCLDVYRVVFAWRSRRKVALERLTVQGVFYSD